ncbi:MAG TPA: ATP-binding protein [Vicinamibacterales bacterium]|nr:ATP-binding protein [Vicinamibacterales bacterium]
MIEAFSSFALIAAASALLALGGAAVLYRRSHIQGQTIRRQIRRDRALKAQFDDVFERVSDIVVVHDRHGRVSTMNRTGEKLSGYPREEVRALDPAWLFSDRYMHTVQQILADGAEALPRTIRAELITRRSARVPIEAHANVLVGDGQVVGVSVIARNMTDRDHMETQLRQTQKMEAVGRLATGIAHDFNNLITVLLGYSDELAEHIGRDSPLRKPVDEVRRAAERASGLTQQLLAFSRRQVPVAQAIDLNVTVANMEDLLRRLLGAEITLQVRLGRDLGLVSADPVQVGQIIMNLAVNARDAMPNGGTLAIETSNVELGAEHLDVIPGEHILLVVRDNGVGMGPDVQRQLFEPFFTTKEAGEGTGLGLSMVYAIVRQSGGHITVTSEAGSGSTFRIYFPLAHPQTAATETAPAIDNPGLERGSGVVLLAEDDGAVRRLLGTELRRRGFTVLEAGHGGEAFEICQQYGGSIDLLLTDVVMPNMNGVDLVAAATPIRPEMSVLFMSGHPERAGVGLDPQGPPAAHLLMKPFTPDTVVARINDILSHKAS